MAKDENLPLFATKLAKGRILFQFYSLLIFVGICFIFVYRLSHIPAKKEPGRWAWMGLFFSELWFSFYWFVTTVVRWNPIYRNTFNNRLSHRYEKALPGIDIFVCTADPVIEPPVMVISTVLSVMAYDYPPEKLSVYLSDDGGSDLTFYAMLEASRFSKIWLPFCKKFKVEPRSPEAYFRTAVEPLGEPIMAKDWSTVKLPKQCPQLEDKQEKRAYDIIQRDPPKLIPSKSSSRMSLCIDFLVLAFATCSIRNESNINIRLLFSRENMVQLPQTFAWKTHC